MKLYVNRLPVQGPWGGGNMMVKALDVFCPAHDVETVSVHNIADADMALLININPDWNCAGLDYLLKYRKTRGNPMLILRVNENDARKNTNNVDVPLIKAMSQVDGVIFVSHWLKKYFEEKCGVIPNKNVAVIHNGVDNEIFSPKEKFDNGKINIAAHHWSNNHNKGFDIYNKIDEFVDLHPDFSFTYIGRENETFKNTKIIAPLFGKELGDELGRYDVYISGSRFDPGPNHVLESLSCQIPTYVHVDGGGCVEFAGDDHVFNDWNDLKKMLLRRDFKKNTSFVPTDWDTCVKKCVSFFADVMKNRIT